MAPLVFLITGTSTGFGHEYVKICLAAGHRVVATARDASRLSFPDVADASQLLLADLDVTEKASVDAAFGAALARFGRVDVVCNNAGFGLAGAFETLADDQIRRQMEVNFFGLLDVTRRAMEVMRDEQSPPGGVIQQVTSLGAQTGVPLFSTYCASKWAVEGFTEALAKEVKPEWGIKFTCIEPGGFRTDWAGRSMVFGEPHPKYDHLNAREIMGKRHGSQPGDPKKGAQAFYDLAVMPDPPLRCAVGTDSYAVTNEKLDAYRENLKKYEKLSNSTDVDGYKKPE